VTEVLISLKFDWATFTKPLPRHIALLWLVGLGGLLLWTVWHFYLQRLLTHTEKRSNGQKEMNHEHEMNQEGVGPVDKVPHKKPNNDVRLRRNKVSTATN